MHGTGLVGTTLTFEICTERQREAEERILSKFLDSPDAEWIIVGRWRRIESREASANAERRRLLTEYIARQRHYHTGLLGEAFEKAGWSEKLIEEFGWRIEAIRGGASTAAGR